MQVLNGSKSFPSQIKACVLTIGNFDGVHLGHQELIGRVVKKARELKIPAVALTFDPHPVQVLHPGKDLKRLFDNEDRTEMMNALGVDYLVVEPFSRELSGQSPEWFISQYVVKTLHAVELLVGSDFTFGQNRSGTPEVLQKLCVANGISCETVPPVRIESEVVSSTRIRQAVAEGSVAKVRTLLGRPYFIKGVIEKGAGRGKKIGFPTANLFTTAQLYPKSGVYITRSFLRDRWYNSITNVGKNPTFEKGTRHPIQVETHILDFDEDIYGENMKVEFLEYCREEKKFENVDSLVTQIKKDVDQARSYFENKRNENH